MKRLFCLIILFLFFWGGGVISSPIAKSWIYSTILIENEWGGTGTGFLVSRKIKEDKLRIFLCTNKHVLNKEKSMRDKATKIVCYINVKDKNDKIIGKSHELALTWSDGSKRWKEHPEDNVDVLAFDVTDLIIKIPEMEKKWADYSLFADLKVISEQEITIGEDIMIVGYPLGFKQGSSNLPIVRQGIIASHIGQEYHEEVLDKQNKKETRILRGFLVDCGLIPGSSGSPVILKPVTGRFVGNTIILGTSTPYLLGIVAETRFAPIKTNIGNIPSYAGLGFAFDAQTVKETIELFFK